MLLIMAMPVIWHAAHHGMLLCPSYDMIVQIYFRAAFDKVFHQGILYKLCSLGIGGSVLAILTQFISNRSQHVTVDGCRSKLINVVSGVLRGSVSGQVLFLLYTSEQFSLLENWLFGFADDSTLLSVVSSPDVRVTVEQSLNRDLGKVSECCDLCGIKLNASKTKTMIVYRLRIMYLQSAPLNIGGTVLKESDA